MADGLYQGRFTPKSVKHDHTNVRFRSKLEARWAVFFEEMYTKYVYEPRTFSMRHFGKLYVYTPDFWLPKSKLFVEVKPFIGEHGFGAVSDELEAKIAFLAWHTHCDVALVCGPPLLTTNVWKRDCDIEERCVGRRYFYERDTPKRDALFVNSDEPHRWCVCPICGALDFHFDGKLERIARHNADCSQKITGPDAAGASNWVKEAEDAARKIRPTWQVSRRDRLPKRNWRGWRKKNETKQR